LVTPKHQPPTKEYAITAIDRDAVIEDVIRGYEALMQRLAGVHAPEFLEVQVTMPQAKLLYLLAAAGDLHMSGLVARLGVSLSTVSGLVDRIVDHGLAHRREDPADRRQVVVGLTAAGTAFIDHFRELGADQMRDLLTLLDDDELDSVRRSTVALARAAARRTAAESHTPARHGAATQRKDP
jgi:DNA-binding MarR family transcriptional regulator